MFLRARDLLPAAMVALAASAAGSLSCGPAKCTGEALIGCGFEAPEDEAQDDASFNDVGVDASEDAGACRSPLLTYQCEDARACIVLFVCPG